MSCSVCRVRNDRPRPTRKADSRMEVLPDPLGPKTRFRPGANSSAAVERLRRPSIFRDARLTRPAPEAALQPHRHHDVARLRSARRANQAAAVGIGEPDFHGLGIDCRECIQQVGDIETDLELLALVVDLYFILRFFLLGVMRLQLQRVLRQSDANTAILLIRQDGGTLQCSTKRITLDDDGFARTGRNDPAIIRKLAVNKLRSEANIADLEPN